MNSPVFSAKDQASSLVELYSADAHLRQSALPCITILFNITVHVIFMFVFGKTSFRVQFTASCVLISMEKIRNVSV